MRFCGAIPTDGSFVNSVPKSEAAIRVLCLGNDLLADDAVGPEVARRLRRFRPELDVVATAETGYYLLDYIPGCDRLIVVDSIAGLGDPGTIHILRESDLHTAPGASPHGMGLLDTLAAGRKLGLRMPKSVVMLAMEAADLTTVGGPMTPAVRSSLPTLRRMVLELAAADVLPDVTPASPNAPLATAG